MGHSEKIKKYCSDVCGQIRFKEAKPAVYDEIRSHICDQRDAYMEEGYSEAEAVTKAIEQMGDPVVVGTELDKVHRPESQSGYLVWVSIIAIVAMVIRFAVLGNMRDLRTIGSTVIGIGVMVLAYFYGFSLIKKYSKKIVFLHCALCPMAYFFCESMRGMPFIFLGPIRINASLIFLSLIFLYGLLLCVCAGYEKNGIIIGIIGFLFMLCWGLIVTGISFSVFFASSSFVLTFCMLKRGGFDKYGKILLALIGISLLCLLTLWVLKNPVIYDEEIFHSVLETKWFGGGKIAYYSYRDEGFINDYMLFILIHRYGWAAFSAVISILGILIFMLLFKNTKNNNIFSMIIAMSGIMILLSEIMIYIISNFGFMFFPSTTLPFLSGGNVGTIFNFSIIGLILSALRHRNVCYVNEKAL